jgi:hypothetical protein
LPEEAKKIASVLTGGKLDAISSTGFFAAGQNYTFTRGEASDGEGGVSFVQGRCKEAGKTSQGIIVMCTGQTLLFGVHDPAFSSGASFGKVNTDMGRVADYIIESGY